MRLKLKSKLLILCCGILSVIFLVVLLIGRGGLVDNQYQFIKNESQKITHILSSLLTDSIKNKSSDLMKFVKDQRQNKLAFYNFDAVIQIENKNSKLIQKKVSSKVPLPDGYGNVILNKLSLTKIDQDKTYLQPIKSPYGQDLIAVINHSGLDIFIALFKNEYSTMIGKFALDHSDIVILNEEGFVLADSSFGIVGQKRVEDPVVRAIKNQNVNPDELFYYSDNSKEMVSNISSLANTNLYVSTSVPRDIIYSSANLVTKNIVVVGISVILIACGIILFLFVYISDNLKQPSVSLSEPELPEEKVEDKPKLPDSYGIDTKWQNKYKLMELTSQSNLENARKESFKEFSSFIISKVIQPLSGAIGYLQIIKNKNTNPKLVRHIDNQEQAMRDVQDVVDKLAQYVNADFREKVALNINNILQDSIELMEHNLDSVKLNINLSKSKPVFANAIQLRQAFCSLLSKVCDELKTADTKELHIRCINLDSAVRIAILYSGSTDFDFEPSSTDGLDMAACAGIIEEHGGKVYSSFDNNNAVITVELPVLKREVFFADHTKLPEIDLTQSSHV